MNRLQIIFPGAALLLILTLLGFLSRSGLKLSEVPSVPVAESLSDEGPEAPLPMAVPERPAQPDPEPYFSQEMLRLIAWIDAGRPLDLQIGARAPRRYSFRPTMVTAEDFQMSTSPTEVMAASWKVYEGRELLGAGRLGDAASLAVVNDALSVAVTIDGQKYLVETDPATERLVAVALPGSGSGEDFACDPLECSGPIASGDGASMHGMHASEALSREPWTRIPVALEYGGEAAPEEPEAAWVDHPYFRRGPAYDASLKDMLVLMISGSTQTGSSANLSSRAASYLSYAARVADTYERQLGLRYLLQELILIADDSGQDDIEYDDSETPNDLGTGSDDLSAVRDWCALYRPRASYGWGHVAGWTLVNGDSGRTIGWSWLDSYGSSSYAFSVQERNWDWDVHAHELGHNVGASHTVGGVMNGSIRQNNENFFTENDENGGYTAAMDIYNYMSSPFRNVLFGPADLRHPEEMPFGQDDSVSTPLNTAIAFDPLLNDDTSVLFGAVNVLRLVEVGQVFPKAAGSVEVLGHQIHFTPAIGFTGNVWFSYTLAGDVGNDGKGWLHSADVVITVGGDNSDPGETPVMDLTDDVVDTGFVDAVRINPLLNDEGTGRLWAGNVDVLSQIDGTAEAYSEGSFFLVDAVVLSGLGSVALETVAMTRDAGSSTGHTGYLVYTPGAEELDVVTIQYTVQDANGNQAVGAITLNRVPTVDVSVDVPALVEGEGRVAEVRFTRSENADTSRSEDVSFQLSGTVDFMGANADIALAGFDSLDAQTLSGLVSIPEGARSRSIYISASADEVIEGTEALSVEITGLESLSLGANAVGSLQVVESPEGNVNLYAENFDAFDARSGIGSGAGAEWSNETGEAAFEADWLVQSGATASPNTGPNGDYSSGSGRYLYIEASGNSEATASLLSPYYDLAGVDVAYLEFAYHMFGNSMGELHLDVRVDDGPWQADFMSALVGQQSIDGDDWKVATLDLSALLGARVQFRFRGITGTSFTSDICIDDVRIFRPLDPGPEPLMILGEPTMQNLESGDPLYLGVVVQGLPRPSYQWTINGSPIPGATGSTYYLPATDGSDAGIYSVDVVAASTIRSREVLVSVGDEPVFAYDQDWKDLAYGLSENGSDTDLLSDYNHDGRLNIVDYAFRIFPGTPGHALGKLPRLTIADQSADRFGRLTFRRMIRGSGDLLSPEGYRAGGVNYTVEFSDTLAEEDWEAGSIQLEMVGSPISNGDGTESVTVQMKSPVDAVSQPKGFLRVRIEPLLP